MRERPILFSSEMVRAILDGRKTQTRRVMKPQPGLCAFESDAAPGYARFGYDYFVGDPADNVVDQTYHTIKCPYGQPGDRLWVRETWCVHPYALEGADKDEDMIVYRANDYGLVDSAFTWKPSIYMPRWASRITLEVVNVRVERLQNISEEDIYAEGIDTNSHDFIELWNSINAKRGHGWDTNPFVWAVEFRRVEP